MTQPTSSPLKPSELELASQTNKRLAAYQTYLRSILPPSAYLAVEREWEKHHALDVAVWEVIKRGADKTADEISGTPGRVEPEAGRKMIWVTFQQEGIHLYPAAATDPALATGDWDDVSFLGVAHRHIFHFRVAIEVTHNDRDIEFIQFKRWLSGLISPGQGVMSLNHKSCEMISDELHRLIAARYPGRLVTIEVAEDGENGSIVTYPRTWN